MINFLISRMILWVVATLLGLQAFVLWADMTMETLFFDELFGLGINGALAWLIVRQRKLLKGLKPE